MIRIPATSDTLAGMGGGTAWVATDTPIATNATSPIQNKSQFGRSVDLVLTLPSPSA